MKAVLWEHLRLNPDLAALVMGVYIGKDPTSVEIPTMALDETEDNVCTFGISFISFSFYNYSHEHPLKNTKE
jgi:hypothetical protein